MLLKPISMMKAKTGDGGGTTPVAITLDGSTDYLERNSDFTSDADSTQITFYAKVAATGATSTILQNGLSYFLAQINIGYFTIQLKDTGGTTILLADTDFNNPDMDDGTEREIMVSYDGVAGTVQIYIDGVLDTDTPYTTVGTGTIDLTRGNWALGALVNSSSKFVGNMTRVALWRDVALDLSVSGNRDTLADPDDTASVGGTLMMDSYTETDITAFDNQAGTGVWVARNGNF